MSTLFCCLEFITSKWPVFIRVFPCGISPVSYFLVTIYCYLVCWFVEKTDWKMKTVHIRRGLRFIVDYSADYMSIPCYVVAPTIWLMYLGCDFHSSRCMLGWFKKPIIFEQTNSLERTCGRLAGTQFSYIGSRGRALQVVMWGNLVGLYFCVLFRNIDS